MTTDAYGWKELCSIDSEYSSGCITLFENGFLEVYPHYEYYTEGEARKLYEAMKEYFEGEGDTKGQETDV
jgi:hypothetical protein